jgi:predicted small lipoprotein YifL
MRAALRLALAGLTLASLAGCGRTGPPRPPGPREAITYPRAYPARDTPGPANAAPVPVAPPIPVPAR